MHTCMRMYPCVPPTHKRYLRNYAACIAILPVTIDKFHSEPRFCLVDYKCSLSDDGESPPNWWLFEGIIRQNVMKTFILLSIRDLATIHSIEHPCLTLMICGCTGKYHRKRSSHC